MHSFAKKSEKSDSSSLASLKSENSEEMAFIKRMNEPVSPKLAFEEVSLNYKAVPSAFELIKPRKEQTDESEMEKFLSTWFVLIFTGLKFNKFL